MGCKEAVPWVCGLMCSRDERGITEKSRCSERNGPRGVSSPVGGPWQGAKVGKWVTLLLSEPLEEPETRESVFQASTAFGLFDQQPQTVSQRAGWPRGEEVLAGVPSDLTPWCFSPMATLGSEPQWVNGVIFLGDWIPVLSGPLLSSRPVGRIYRLQFLLERTRCGLDSGVLASLRRHRTLRLIKSTQKWYMKWNENVSWGAWVRWQPIFV